ncbi:hypothetical protein LOK49_LG04G01738 [Camellia lanceoleosa]|uniref:Uncharacterized protein n=1 Tax=Camellia lanceoleosa TaxID=1840588 RepID=A0ACC0I3Y7_9ERIC|nr:hypothetical protein LOK49_LG04G01738 [Camellia lanceoleosa]
MDQIWVWDAPVEMEINGVKTSIFYLDTEGFESIGKIFALATMLSSVLIYNLAETVCYFTSMCVCVCVSYYSIEHHDMDSQNLEF